MTHCILLIEGIRGFELENRLSKITQGSDLENRLLKIAWFVFVLAPENTSPPPPGVDLTHRVIGPLPMAWLLLRQHACHENGMKLVVSTCSVPTPMAPHVLLQTTCH